MPGDFASLGTDGFGLSDTRAAVRRHFHVDGPEVAYRALQMLARRGEVDRGAAGEGLSRSTACTTSPPGTSGNAGGDA